MAQRRAVLDRKSAACTARTADLLAAAVLGSIRAHSGVSSAEVNFPLSRGHD